MPKKIIVAIIIALVVIVGALLLLAGPEKPAVSEEVFTMEESREIAENWIINNSPTYIFDGFDLRLWNEEELLEGAYSFIFSFESRAAGYGDRTDQIVAQVITPHLMEIIVEEGEVIMAITDEVYDEIEEQMMIGEQGIPEM